MIQSMYIENFKCFRNHTIHFAPVTVLVGANGTGKSSVVQAILLTRQLIEERDSVNRGRSIDKYDREFEIMLNHSYMLQLGNAASILSMPAEPHMRFTLVNGEGTNTEIKFSHGNTATHMITATIDHPQVGYTPLTGCFRYLHAERLGPRKALDMAATTRIDVGCQGEYVSHAIYYADKTKKAIHEKLILDTKASRFSHHVESWMQFLFPDIKLEVQTLDDQNMVVIQYSDNLLDNRFILPTNTGFGISYTLPIVVAGLLLTSDENSTLVVENPEAHLHPLGQSRMGRFLAALSLAGIQVVVETHSEHIVNGMRIFMSKIEKNHDFSIQFFTKTDQRVQIETLELLANGELSHWPIGFFDQEQQDLKELLMIKRAKGKK